MKGSEVDLVRPTGPRRAEDPFVRYFCGMGDIAGSSVVVAAVEVSAPSKEMSISRLGRFCTGREVEGRVIGLILGGSVRGMSSNPRTPLMMVTASFMNSLPL